MKLTAALRLCALVSASITVPFTQQKPAGAPELSKIEVDQAPEAAALGDAMRAAPGSQSPLLSDILGSKQCTIMSDYTLNLQDVVDRLRDPSKITLILAPLNSAIVALPRKPWMDDPDSNTEGDFRPQKSEDRAAKNLENFVKRHVIPEYPLRPGKVVLSLAHQSVKLEILEDGKKVINGKYEVISEKTAANGALWIISGVLEPQKDPRHLESL